jgi:hypothetical protein
MANAVVVGLDRLVTQAVGDEANQDLVEAFHPEREQGMACLLGVLVDNDPCGSQ